MTQVSLLDQLDLCEKRSRGSAESRDAHAKIVAGKKIMHERIMYMVQARGDYGITVHELAAAFGKTPNCVSGRLSELRMTGRLRKSGARRNGAAVLVR